MIMNPFLEKLKSVFLNELRRISLIVTSLLLLLFGYEKYITTIKTDYLTQQLEKQISEELGYETKIDQVGIEAFPLPKLKLYKISIGDSIFINEASVYPTISSSLLRKFVVDRIDINQIFVNPNQLKTENSSYTNFVRTISALKTNKFNLCYKQIWDTGYTNRIFAEDGCIQKNKSSINLHTNLQGLFRIQDTIYYSDNVWDSHLTVTHDNSKISLNRKFNNNAILEGDFEGKIENPSKFVSDLSNIYDFALNKNIISVKNINFSGQIINENDVLTLDKIMIVGEDINISGKYIFTSKPEENDLFTVEINKLNADEIFGIADNTISNNTPLFKLENSSTTLLAKAKEITAFKNQVTNFALEISYDGSNLKINNCRGKIDTKGEFMFSAYFEDNEFRPKLNGELYLSHKNINSLLANMGINSKNDSDAEVPMYLKSEFISTPLDIKLQNFKLFFGKESLSGNINLKFSGKDKILIGDLVFSNLDVNNTSMPLIKDSYDYIISLAHEMRDDKYLSKFIPIRTSSYKTIVDINAENLIVNNDNIINKAGILLSYDDGQIKIDNFLFEKDGDFNLHGDIKIVANSLRPQFRIKIVDGYINFDKIDTPLIDQYILLSQENIDLSKIDLAVDAFLSSVKIGNNHIENISGQAQNANNVLVFSDLKFENFDGSGQISGSIGLDPVKLSFVYGVNGLNLTSLLNFISPQNLPIQKGYISINGQISSTANNYHDLINNAYVKGDFLAKEVTFQNIDFDGFIIKLSTINLDPQNLERIFTDSTYSGDTTFTSINGNYVIDSQLLIIKEILFNTNYLVGSAGFAMNLSDLSIDLNSLFTFFPVNAKLVNQKETIPIKANFAAKGNLFAPDKLLTIPNKDDIKRISKLIGNVQNGR